MTRRTLAAALMTLLLLVVAPLSAHDEFRFVGTVVVTDAVKNRLADAGAHDVFRFVGNVIKWDARKNAVDVKTKETWDGKESEYIRHIVLRSECVVTRHSKKVSRSELKPGVYVVVDAAGVDINDLEGTAIDIIPASTPKKK